MRKKYMVIITGIIFAALIFGLVGRSSRTDIASKADYLEYMYVAELPSKLAVSACEKMRPCLMDAPIVLRVTPEGPYETNYQTFAQKVRIREVYKGDGLSDDDIIYISGDSGGIGIYEEINAFETYFVNIMKEDNDYLVFISGVISEMDRHGLPVYRLSDFGSNVSFAPVFCYSDIENRISLDFYPFSTYVPYADVRDNEFFSDGEEGLKAMETLKAELLQLYPADSIASPDI